MTATFDREIQFYVAYLEHIAPLRAAGLCFAYPQVVERATAVRAYETFDLALAAQLIGDQREVVRNDFELHPPERVLVVTGANQGG